MRTFGPYPAFGNTGLNDGDDCLWQLLFFMVWTFEARLGIMSFLMWKWTILDSAMAT